MKKLWEAIEKTIIDSKERRIKIGKIFIVIRKKEEAVWLYYGNKIYDTSGIGDIETLYKLTIGCKEDIEEYLNEKNK